MEPSARRSFHLGRYHCTETLATSPLGETFRAKVYGVAGLEKQYALKQIDVALRVEPELRQRLVEAARRYASLEHDRIAKLTEIHDDVDGLYLVTELARGIDLPRLIGHLRTRGESLPVEQAILIAADIAEGLEVAARPSEAAPQGVLHLGLCPSVVSVLSEGEIRVGDFALAEAVQRPGWAEDDALAPIIAYSAPERLGADGVTPPMAASDAWSLGAVLFELCTGQALLAGETAAQLAAARTSLPWDKLPARAGLREALDKLLAPAAADRPQSGQAARELLAGLLGLELTRARAGLQALVKRALGRTLTRTGSFAAVQLQSQSLPTLVQEPPAAAPGTGTRSVLGAMSLNKMSMPVPADATPKARGWAPPRPTGVMQSVRSTVGVQTLPGLGGDAVPEPPLMEMAELPPSAEVTVTERTMDAIGFDDGVTSPHNRPDRPAEPREEVIDALEADALELTDNDPDVHDAPTRHGMPPIPPAAFPSRNMPVVPEPPVQAAPTSSAFSEQTTLAPASPAEQAEQQLASLQSAPALKTLTPTDEPRLPSSQHAVVPEIDGRPPAPAAPPPIQAPPARASTPGSSPPRGSGAWIIGGVAGLAIAMGIVVAVEQGGFTGGQTQVDVPPLAKPQARKVEAPKVEAPKVDAPKVEAPKVDAPKVEAPKSEAELKAEAKQAEAAKKAEAEAAKQAAATKKAEDAAAKKAEAEAAKQAAATKKAEDAATKKAEAEAAKQAAAKKVEAPKVEAAVAAAGQLAITTSVPGATVWIDGEPKGQTPLTTPASVGKHRVVIVQQGMKLVQKLVSVEDKGASLAVPLEPARLPTEVAGEGNGGLKVRCHTIGELRILVDGNDTGMTCPNNDRINVEPGVHQIGLVSPRTGATHEIEGEVEEDTDHSTRIYVRF